MKKILGMGNALTDILFKLSDDTLLEKLNISKGGMFLIDEEEAKKIKTYLSHITPSMATGGSASNTINAIAKMGAKSGFIGKVKDDEIGNFFKSQSIENGVNPHLIYSDTISGHCNVLISPDSERTMCTFLGAGGELTAADLKIEMFEDYDYFHIEGYLVQNHELIRTALRLAKEAGLTTSIDLASFNVVQENLEFLQDIVAEYVDICFANEEEAYEFTKEEAADAVKSIAKVADIAIVKIGKNGSYVRQGEQEVFVNAYLTDAVDTTGAGDFYAAGFLFGLASGYNLEQSGKIGSFISSKVVEVVGTKLADEVWEEAREFVVQL